jgi:hypothetical protein
LIDLCHKVKVGGIAMDDYRFTLSAEQIDILKRVLDRYFDGKEDTWEYRVLELFIEDLKVKPVLSPLLEEGKETVPVVCRSATGSANTGNWPNIYTCK